MTAPARLRGMVLVSAIFLMIVLVVLGGAMVTLSSVEQDTGAKSLAQTRVYYGAKAGLEWAIHQAIAPTGTTGCSATPVAFPLQQGALNGISVTVTCSFIQHGGADYTFYLTSTATSGAVADPYYAERRLEATLVKGF